MAKKQFTTNEYTNILLEKILKKLETIEKKIEVSKNEIIELTDWQKDLFSKNLVEADGKTIVKSLNKAVLQYCIFTNNSVTIKWVQKIF